VHADATAQIKTVDPGHVDVEDDEIGQLGDDEAERLLRVAHVAAHEACAAQDVVDEARAERVVVDDEHLRKDALFAGRVGLK
jgi:hypothetical protein